MQGIVAIALLLLVTGCATTGSSNGECTRFSAATRAYGQAINPIDMQNKAIKECRRGDPYACVSAPVAIPYTSLLYVVGLPLLVPIFMASDNVYSSQCSLHVAR